MRAPPHWPRDTSPEALTLQHVWMAASREPRPIPLGISSALSKDIITARPHGDTHQFHSYSLQPKNHCSIRLTPPSSADPGLGPWGGDWVMTGGILGMQTAFA